MATKKRSTATKAARAAKPRAAKKKAAKKRSPKKKAAKKRSPKKKAGTTARARARPAKRSTRTSG